MPTVRLLASTLGLAYLSATASLSQAGPEPYVNCGELLQTKPQEESTADCFVNEKQRVGRQEDGAKILEDYIERTSEFLPWVLYSLGQMTGGEKAFGHLRAARDFFEQEGERKAAFKAQLALINRMEYEGELERAQSELEETRAMIPADAPYAVDRLRLAEAALMTSTGDLDAAFSTLTEIEDRVIPGAPDDLRAELFYRKHLVFYELGQYREAGTALERSADIIRALDFRYRESGILYQLATIKSVQLGEAAREQVVDQLREALSVAEEVGRTATVVKAHLELARFATEREENLGHLDECLALRERLPARIVSGCLGTLAFEMRLEDPESARRTMDEALAIVEESEDPWQSVYLWADRLPVSWATRSREQAIQESFESLEDIEALRESMLDDATSARYFAVWAEAYNWLAGKLLTTSGPPIRRQDLELAFDVAERFRARVLLERLQQAGAWPDLPEVHRDEVRAHPTDVLEQVERTLRDGEAMLAFQLGDWKDRTGRFAGGSWLFAVDATGSKAYRLDEVGPLVDRLEELLGSQESLDAAFAEELYTKLLHQPIEELPEEIDKLIIVPDGALLQLPFGSLRPSDGVPLSTGYELSLIPSANIWLRWRQQAGDPEPGLALVLADPSRPEPSVQGGAGELRDGVDPVMRACRQLPFAREEGEAILRKAGRSSVLLIGEQASESYLKQADLRPFGVIHLASHAFVNLRDAEKSMICLAPGGHGEDGNLRVREIVNLDLDGQLVVLAACDSASGPRLAGEGVMSLARAFFLAGARTVVGSLKAINDADAKDFFVRFHGHLADGHSAASAIRATKKEIYDALGPEAVYENSAWTHVVVLGDGALKPLRAEMAASLFRSWLFWAGAILIIYLVSIGIRVWLQRR